MTYKEFISSIIANRGQHQEDNFYWCKHHILPNCLGGSGDYISKKTGKSMFKKNSTHKNCIYLTKYEHKFAHKLLFLENKSNSNLAYAWHSMSYEDKDIEFEDIKLLDEAKSIAYKEPWNKGKIGLYRATEETRQKMSDSQSIRWEVIKSDEILYNDICNNRSRLEKKYWDSLSKSDRLVREVICKENLSHIDCHAAGKRSEEARREKEIYSDGKICKYFTPGEEPEGWFRSKRLNSPKTNNHSGKRLYTNGVEQHYYVSGEEPEGYIWTQDIKRGRKILEER